MMNEDKDMWSDLVTPDDISPEHKSHSIFIMICAFIACSFSLYAFIILFCYSIYRWWKHQYMMMKYRRSSKSKVASSWIRDGGFETNFIGIYID